MSEPLIHAWIQILKANENSRLLIKSAQLEDRQLRQGFIDRFLEAGIAPERLELLGLIRDSQGHLAKYLEVDLALDTFPYNGTTTSCEAMWMGVPVLGLKGNTHAGRVGASLLHRVGLDEFVAETVDEYISKAIGFASQQDRLARLRSQLRTRMQTSALGDGAAFTMNLETSFKKLWRELCETKTSRHD